MTNRELEVVAVTKETDLKCYPDKAELIASLQKGVDQMVKDGTMPPSAKVTDVRVITVRFLVEREDGKARELEARVATEQEYKQEFNTMPSPKGLM